MHAPEFEGEDGVALWSVWSEKGGNARAGVRPSRQIVYTPLMGRPKQHRQLEESGQGHRIVRAIKRRNEDGSVYDLTREW